MGEKAADVQRKTLRDHQKAWAIDRDLLKKYYKKWGRLSTFVLYCTQATYV